MLKKNSQVYSVKYWFSKKNLKTKESQIDNKKVKFILFIANKPMINHVS